MTNDINPDYTIDIPVKKVWKGDPTGYRFDTVTVQLYKNGELDGIEVEIKEVEGWEYTFVDKPYYTWDEGQQTYIVNQYDVKETKVGSNSVENCKDWLFVEISGSAEEGFVITNNVPQVWYIGKVSSTDHTQPLDNAEFTLTEESEPEESEPDTIYYGRSIEGIVYWWSSSQDLGDPNSKLNFIPDGTYILEETKAPEGYQKSEITWTIKIQNLCVVSIVDSNGNKIHPESPETRGAFTADLYLYENQVELYELPSTGGPGIHLYMLGGTLLMMAGALLVYKKRKEEVLRS